MDGLEHLNPGSFVRVGPTQRARPLFAITAELVKFHDTVDESGEVSDELDVWFSSLEAEEGVKLDGYLNVVKTLAMERDAAKSEAAQYTLRAKVRDNRIAQLEGRLRLHLEATGRTRIETATGRPIRLVGNGGKLPLVIGDGVDVAKLPVEFIEWNVSINRDAVREVLEAGEQLSFARLGERGTNLRIG